jgi:hypothetical protein
VPDITAGLHPALSPLVWLIGVWEGPGHIPAAEQGQDPDPAYLELLCEPADGAQLEYHLRLTAVGRDGEQGAELGRETGWLRVSVAQAEHEAEVELLVAHERGFIEVSVGRVSGGRIELTSDLVASTPSGTTVGALQRLYGIHNSQLLVAVDEATGDGLSSRYWGQLDRRPGTGWRGDLDV